MHRSAQSCTQVSGAGGDVAEMVIVGELGYSLDVSRSAAQAIEYLLDVSSLLHGNDTQLVFFIDPDQEGFLVVMEDTAA